MAGHSKWANIKHRKGRQDAKRGKIFTKVTKEIMLAARLGGGDPDMNPRLRAAVDAAKAVNLPKDKIDTGIKKGTGELGAENIEEVIYEGYAPGGVALLIETATDNKNRTVSEVRHMLSKAGGSMGEAGSVSWMFDFKGVLRFDKQKYTEDQLLEVGLESGVEDVLDEQDFWEVRVAPTDYAAVQDAFAAAGIEQDESELTMVPKNTVVVDAQTGLKVIRLCENLEDHDDVQKVHANFDLPDDFDIEGC